MKCLISSGSSVESSFVHVNHLRIEHNGGGWERRPLFVLNMHHRMWIFRPYFHCVVDCMRSISIERVIGDIRAPHIPSRRIN